MLASLIYKQRSIWLTHQIIELNGGDTTIDTRDNLLGDGDGIDMVHVQTVTQSGNTGRDLVELNTLLAAICRLLTCEPSTSLGWRLLTTLPDEHGGGIRRGSWKRGRAGLGADLMQCSLAVCDVNHKQGAKAEMKCSSRKWSKVMSWGVRGGCEEEKGDAGLKPVVDGRFMGGRVFCTRRQFFSATTFRVPLMNPIKPHPSNFWPTSSQGNCPPAALSKGRVRATVNHLGFRKKTANFSPNFLPVESSSGCS